MATLGEGSLQGNRSIPSASYLTDMENQAGGGTYTATATQPSIKDYENVFGPIARNIKDDLQMHKRHGRWHLPDVLKGSNPWLADRIDGLISDANNSPFTTFILPYRYHENVDGKVKWNVWSFDEGMASRVPYESAARHLTQSKKSYAGYLTRSGLAIKMEHNFMMTPKGRENFQNNLMQLIGSIQYTNDYDVTMALVTAPSYETERRTKYMDTTKSPLQLCREYVDIFGFVQKNPNALDILIEEAKFRMKEWNGPQPNFMLVNAKLGFIMNMTPEKTNWYAQGPDGVKRLKAGPELNSYRGLRVVNTRSFQTETGLHPRDMLRRRVRVAEYYRILPDPQNADREFELYNEARDSWFSLNFHDLIKMSLHDETNPLAPETTATKYSPQEQSNGMQYIEERFNKILDRIIESKVLEPGRRPSTRMEVLSGRKPYAQKHIGMAYSMPTEKIQPTKENFEDSLKLVLRENIYEANKDDSVIFLLSDQGEKFDWLYLSNCGYNFQIFEKNNHIFNTNAFGLTLKTNRYKDQIVRMAQHLAPYPNFYDCFQGKVADGCLTNTEFIHVLSRRYAYDMGFKKGFSGSAPGKCLVLQPVGAFYEPNNSWFMNAIRTQCALFASRTDMIPGSIMYPFNQWYGSEGDNVFHQLLICIVGNTIIDVEMAHMFYRVISDEDVKAELFFTNIVDNIAVHCEQADQAKRFETVGECSILMKKLFTDALKKSDHTNKSQKIKLDVFIRKSKIVTMWGNEPDGFWMKDINFITYPTHPQNNIMSSSSLFNSGHLQFMVQKNDTDNETTVTALNALTDKWVKTRKNIATDLAAKITATASRKNAYSLFSQLMFTRIIGDCFQLSTGIAKQPSTDELSTLPERGSSYTISFSKTDFENDNLENQNYPFPMHKDLAGNNNTNIVKSSLIGLPVNVLTFSNEFLLNDVKRLDTATGPFFNFLFGRLRTLRGDHFKTQITLKDGEANRLDDSIQIATWGDADGDTYLQKSDSVQERDLADFQLSADELDEVKFFLRMEKEEYLTGKTPSRYTTNENPQTIAFRRRASFLLGMQKIHEREEEIQKKQKEIEDLQGDLTSVRDELANITQEKEEAAREIQTLRDEIRSNTEEIERLRAIVSEGGDEATREVLVNFNSKLKELTHKLEDAEEKVQTITKDYHALKGEERKLTETLSETKIALASAQTKFNEEKDAMAAELRLLKAENLNLKSQLGTLGAPGSYKSDTAVSKGSTREAGIAAISEFLIVRPNIEHNMMGIILGMAGEQLGYTLWGQTELAVYDDSMHGLWGMSYKYHSKAIVFNFKNLIRLWDVCYDGYNGGKDDTFVEWTNDASVKAFFNATTDVSKNYHGPSMMVFRFDHDYPSNVSKNLNRNWPSPIVFHEVENEDEEGSHMRYGLENEQILDVQGFRVFKSEFYKVQYGKYLPKIPPFSHLHNTRKGAAESIDGDETTGEALAFQGSMRIKSAVTGAIISEIHGSGHHGPDYVGVASIRAGKGVRNPSSLPSLFRPI